MIFLSGGFRPFFLGAALWAAIAMPVWLTAYVHGYAIGGALPAMLWHAHEMVYGFAVATLAGFLLTAIPNWTGRLPVRGAALGVLAALWLAGRVAMFFPPVVAALVDPAFLAALMAVVARELVAGRNFRNLPLLGALGVLLAGNVLMHLHALGVTYTAALGARVGVATLAAMIALIGGRIVPSFTRNWLAKARPGARMPAPTSRLDMACLVVAVAGLAAWVAAPAAAPSRLMLVAAAAAVALRLSRWRSLATLGEPLLWILHAGYAWLAAGLALAAIPGAPAVHALTVGAVGTMTLAVMTRASLGHAGQPLAAGPGTTAIYVLILAAAVLRVAAPYVPAPVSVASLAGVAWTAAFGLFAFLYGPLLLGMKK